MTVKIKQTQSRFFLILLLVLSISCRHKNQDTPNSEPQNNRPIKAVNTEPKTIASVGDQGKFIETLTPQFPTFQVEDLSHKVVYIANWATWCAPCLKSNQKFIEKFDTLKDLKNLVFVFVSFDTNEYKWNEYINKHFPESSNIIHLYNGFELDSKYSNYYNILDLPNYFVLGMDGKIKAQSVISASDENFIQYLKSLVKH